MVQIVVLVEFLFTGPVVNVVLTGKWHLAHFVALSQYHTAPKEGERRGKLISLQFCFPEVWLEIGLPVGRTRFKLVEIKDKLF